MISEKIGRLKPDETDDSIRVILDDRGEIGRITRNRMGEILAGISPVMGSSDVTIGLLVGDVIIRVYAWQVKGMMERWPWRKAGVWGGYGRLGGEQRVMYSGVSGR